MLKKKIIAVYYPQFHPIEENDKAWGQGFTDWNRVKLSKPQFDTHYQPREPMNDNYYNLTDPKIIENQVRLAQQYGIHGFCFYHYWFDGKLLLEKPLELFLNNKSLNFSFCMSWANETWTKRWVGDAKSVIQMQTHIPDIDIWQTHFDYLLPFFKDERYILVDNKPIFIIYQAGIINNLNEMMDFWQQLAQKSGFEGIYFISTKRHKNIPKVVKTKFDGIMKYQPQEAYNSNNFGERSFISKLMTNMSFAFPESFRSKISKIKDKAAKLNRFDSQKLWKSIITNAYKRVPGYKGVIYESAFVNWDNSPRYGNKANVFSFVTPNQFEHNLKELIKKMDENEADFLFVNAWNEWAEGAYLEPDKKYEYQYLEALKKVIKE